MKKHNFKSAFILGGTSTIAKSICMKLADNGCKKFHLVSRNPAANKPLIEKLRVFYRINRDTTKRGHSKQYVLEQIEKRKPDSDEFIKPQSERANVVFTLLPVNLELLENNNVTYSNVKIQVSIKNGIYYQELVRVLIAICGLQVNIVSIDHTGKVLLEISGDVVSEDINLAVKMLAPHIEELLDFSAKFSGGINGIMQIITIMEINEVLKRRRS